MTEAENEDEKIASLSRPFRKKELPEEEKEREKEEKDRKTMNPSIPLTKNHKFDGLAVFSIAVLDLEGVETSVFPLGVGD